MNNFKNIFLLSIVVCAFCSDSLNMRIDAQFTIPQTRGISEYGGIIYIFLKSPKLYAIQPACGSTLALLDSITWSGSTIPDGTNLAGRWISCVNNYAFLADWNRGVRAINISNPVDLLDDGSLSLPGQARSIAIFGDTLLVSCNSGGLKLVDISTPSTMSMIGAVPVGSSAIDAIGRRNYIYATESVTGLSIWNTTSLSVPISWISMPGTAVNVDVLGDYAVVSVWDNGIKIVNISNPESLSISTSLDLWSDYVYSAKFLSSELIMVCAGSSGLYFLNSRLETAGYYRKDFSVIVSAVVLGNRAFAIDANGTLIVFDISAFHNVQEISTPKKIAISLYPNPFNSSVNIEIFGETKRNKKIEIFDIGGRVINSLSLGEPNYSRPGILSSIWTPEKDTPSGVYLIKFDFDGKNYIKPVIYIK